MQQRMRAESWVSYGNVGIHACGGIITLFGIVDSQAERSALETMARAIPGCKGVDDHLLLYSQVVVSGA
jgi:osmotically-inducible protein OsmY